MNLLLSYFVTPPKKYRKLGNSWLRNPWRGFRLSTFNFRLSISDFPTPNSRFSISDSWLQSSDFRLPASNFLLHNRLDFHCSSACLLQDQSKCTIFEPINETGDWVRSHASTIPLYSNWWEYSRTSMCDHLSRRKPPPPISDHQSKTPKFSHSKPYSWNLS